MKADQVSLMTNQKLITTTKGSAPLIQQAGPVLQTGIKTEANVTPSISLKDKITAIKKEPLSSTPTPTDSESPIVRLMDDKVLSPMQTPVPTSSGQPLSDNLHIILQERNKAVDNFLSESKSTELKATLATLNSSTTTTTKLSPLPPLTSPQFSSTPSTTVCTQQTTTVTHPALVKQSPVSMSLLSPVKDIQSSQSSHSPNSFPITPYLSDYKASQPSKASVLQSLVSAPSTSVPVTVTNTPTLTTSSPAKASASPSATITHVTSPLATITHVTSPLATASVSAPLMQSSPVKDNTTAAHLQATKPSIVTVQPVPTQVSANTTQHNLAAIAISSPVKAALSMASHQIPSKPANSSTDTIAQKKSFSGLTMVSVLKSETSAPNKTKSETTKDIKSLLTLPPSNIKLSVKSGEVSQPLKQIIEQKTPIKQEPHKEPHTGVSVTPMKGITTAIKTEPEIVCLSVCLCCYVLYGPSIN